MFDRCKLEGADLDLAVALGEGLEAEIAEVGRARVCQAVLPGEDGQTYWTDYSPSTDWDVGGRLIERDLIFLNPPSDEHQNGGPTSGWNRYDFWRATVSSRTRQRSNPSGSTIAPLTVGRGAGLTPLVAAMRAYVDSKAA
jgi:hypothetical protein